MSIQVLLVGGPRNGAMQAFESYQSRLTVVVPKTPIQVGYPDEDPGFPDAVFETQNITFEHNHDFEDYVFTLVGATQEEIDKDYDDWRASWQASSV